MNITCIAHITNTMKVLMRLGKKEIEIGQNGNEHLCLIYENSYLQTTIMKHNPYIADM